MATGEASRDTTHELLTPAIEHVLRNFGASHGLARLRMAEPFVDRAEIYLRRAARPSLLGVAEDKADARLMTTRGT